MPSHMRKLNQKTATATLRVPGRIRTRAMKALLRLPLLLLLGASLYGGDAAAQDPQWSQYFANQVHLSPAFTGAANGPRLALNYRSQWAAIADHYKQFVTSFDMPVFFGRTRHGLGGTIGMDRAGAGNLTKVDVLFNYAYGFELPNDRSAIRLGLVAGFQQASIDFFKLRFPDSYDALGNFVPTAETFAQESRIIPEVGAGALYYSELMWVGFDARHITNPKQVFVNETQSGNASKLPVRLATYAGFRLPITRERTMSKTISPSIMYRWQQPFHQVDFATYLTIEPIVVGLGYRFITGGAGPGDAIFGMVGVRRGIFQFGYSYDFTISKLTNPVSGGSHEVSLVIELEGKDPRFKPRVKMSCPRF